MEAYLWELKSSIVVSLIQEPGRWVQIHGYLVALRYATGPPALSVLQIGLQLTARQCDLRPPVSPQDRWAGCRAGAGRCDGA